MNLRDYGRIMVRRGWIILLTTLLTAALAYGWSTLQTPQYRSSATLAFNAQSLDWGRLQALKQRLSSYSNQITAEGAAFRVVDKLQLDLNPYALLSHVNVSPDLNELTIQIDVTDSDPNRAGEIANGLAEDFIAEIEKEQADQLREDRVNVTLLQRAGDGGQIAPRPRINLIAGALIGLVLGGLLVLALELLDDTIKSRDDIEELLGDEIMVLGIVPPAR
ncbi:MAG: bacteriocin immunity protein [Anaerolineales bacterium]|nr:bacteriocin immunity protein [Anaerolineales bacterium]MCB9126296.1 bacteriocin immunity protein [Ardenticatenales bacterium]MCB9171319.1 bacteriocin immunity protein [Ardenticatenales bacterium]